MVLTRINEYVTFLTSLDDWRLARLLLQVLHESEALPRTEFARLARLVANYYAFAAAGGQN